MEMEQYWPQHEVFFIATLSLFPEHLKEHPVTELFYKPYFPRDEIGFIGIMLEEYQKRGYIEYEKDGEYAYKITAVHTQKATDDLIEYLHKWQRNELLSLPASKPPDAAYQQTLLLNALAHAYANHQKEPRITLQDVYGEPGDYTHEPPFWELVISCQLLDKKVLIKYMGYDRRVGGLYDDDTQQLVDFQIVDKKFEQSVVQRAAQTDTREARVFMQGRLVCISISGDKTYTIAKLDENPPQSHRHFINYLLDPENADIIITIDDIKGVKKGLQATSSLSELVRYCGFDRTLKKVFFITIKKNRLHFKPVTQLDNQQVEAIKKQAAKLEEMNRK